MPAFLAMLEAVRTVSSGRLSQQEEGAAGFSYENNNADYTGPESGILGEVGGTQYLSM